MKTVETRRIVSKYAERRRLITEILVDGSPVGFVRERFLGSFIASCIRSVDLTDDQVKRVFFLADPQTVSQIVRIYGRRKAILAVTTWAQSTADDAGALKMCPKRAPAWRALAGEEADRSNHRLITLGF